MADKRIGMKFNNWTLLERRGRYKTNAVYLCRCECGTEKLQKYSGHKLQSKSCGCLKKDTRNHKSPMAIGDLKKFKTIFHRYWREAEERGYLFRLTYDDFCEIINKNCYYCSVPPSNKQMYNKRIEIIYNGIDRVDNQKNYDYPNCVPCCKNCNQIKGKVTIEMCRKVIDCVDLWF